MLCSQHMWSSERERDKEREREKERESIHVFALHCMGRWSNLLSVPKCQFYIWDIGQTLLERLEDINRHTLSAMCLVEANCKMLLLTACIFSRWYSNHLVYYGMCGGNTQNPTHLCVLWTHVPKIHTCSCTKDTHMLMPVFSQDTKTDTRLSITPEKQEWRQVEGSCKLSQNFS